MQERPGTTSVSEGTRAQGFTDGEGSFLAEGLRPGRFAVLAGRPEDTLLLRVGDVDVAASGVARASVKLRSDGRTLTGRVVNGGDPVAGARVTVASATPNATRFGAVGDVGGIGSAADGSFRAGPLPADWTRVVVSASPPYPRPAGA